MKKTFISCIKQAAISIAFAACIVGSAATLVFASADGLLDALRSTEPVTQNFINELILSAFRSDAFMLAMPFLASIVYTTAVTDDLKSGYVRLYLHRTTTAGYLVSKGVVCAVTSALGVLIGIIIVKMGFWMLLLRRMTPTEMSNTKEFFNVTVNVFLMCMLWAQSGLLLSTVTGSRFIAYVSPFIICYLMIIIYERYLPGRSAFYPRVWLEGTGVMQRLLVAELTLLCFVVFFLYGERRLKRL